MIKCCSPLRRKLPRPSPRHTTTSALLSNHDHKWPESPRAPWPPGGEGGGGREAAKEKLVQREEKTGALRVYRDGQTERGWVGPHEHAPPTLRKQETIREETSAWSVKAVPHPTGNRGRNVTSSPRWAARAMQSCGRRVNTEGTHGSPCKGTSFTWKGVRDGPSWDTGGALGESNREGGLDPSAVWLELPSWENPKHCLPLDPRIGLRKHKAAILSPLLELFLAMQRSQ